MDSQTEAPAAEASNAPKKSLGKTLTTVGVSMLAISIVLALAGVSGAVFHNIMQLGGLALAIVGFVMWKVMKK